MQIIEKDINDIIPYGKNPRKNAEAVKYVAGSLREFGFKQPIVIDKDGVVIAGHTRLLAAKKLKLEKVPCLIADDLTEEQVKAYRLADNKTNEFAEWDLALLSEELGDIFDIDMTAFGFEPAEDEGEAEIIEDEVPEPPQEPKAKLGDIYQLGRHRLMCGDSTCVTDIDRLMEGKKADLVFTDPPYGMKKESEGVLNDNLNYDDLLDFNRQWIPLTFGALKENGSWYCWGTDEPLMDIYSNILKPMAKDNKITFRNLITWDKGHGQGQLSEDFRMYPIADEKCLFVMCGVQGFNTNSDNYYEGWEPLRAYLAHDMQKICELKGVPNVSSSWNKLLKNQMGKHYFTKSQWELPTKEQYNKMQELGREYDLFKREYDEIKREYYKTRAYFDNTHDNMNDVWHFDRTGAEERAECGGHATPKPLALCERAIRTSSLEGEMVLDVFGGSGSTLIACEQTGRTCYMMEMEPKYIDVIIQRWENLTGGKAELCKEDKEI